MHAETLFTFHPKEMLSCSLSKGLKKKKKKLTPDISNNTLVTVEYHYYKRNIIYTIKSISEKMMLFENILRPCCL